MKYRLHVVLAVGFFAATRVAIAQDSPVAVTVENFVRAESDLYFGAVAKKGGFGKFDHTRDLTPIDEQTVVRLNRDTLYSAGVFDLDAAPVTIDLPDSGDRFISMHVMNQDQYTISVNYEAGEYKLDRDKVGTRYVMVAVRTLVNPKKPGDLDVVRGLQDSIGVKQSSSGEFEVPSWDRVSQKKVRDALVVLADTLPDRNRMFGSRSEVEPVRYLLGAASAWGGNPSKDAIYLNVVPDKNDGKTIYRLTVNEVPVRDFWSISVYNREGYYQRNDAEIYTINSLTSVANADGSVTVQFGGKPGDAPNVLPIVPGWNYMIRLYRPAPEVLSGEWQFPVATEHK
jgi:hypothetical protein